MTWNIRKMLDTKTCNRLRSHTIWDAVVAWRDYILSSSLERTTKVLYLSRMVYLIKNDFISLGSHLDSVDSSWIRKLLMEVTTKTNRPHKTIASDRLCINNFYKFIIADKELSSLSLPKEFQISHIVTSMDERIRAYDLGDEKWAKLFMFLLKTNPRDYLICYLVWVSGKNVLEILSLRKKDLKRGITGPYIDGKDTSNIVECLIKNKSKGISLSIKTNRIRFNNSLIPLTDDIASMLYRESRSNIFYLFESRYQKKISKNQLVRTLKNASRSVGLDFDVTPRIFQSCAIVLPEARKKNILEKIKK